MNLKKKLTVGVASAALVASMGGLVAPSAFAKDTTNTLPGFITSLGRLSGPDRVGTSLEVAKHAFAGKKPEVLYVASADDKNMVDAAAAGMLQDGPIAFVSNNSYVATAVGKFFAKEMRTISKVVAVGGTSAVSDPVLKAVAKELDAKTERLAGKDRYETSVAIAQYIYDAALKGDYKDRATRPVVSSRSNLNTVYLANGADTHVVDSMVAGTLDNGPVLLVAPDGKIPEKVAEFIKKTLPERFAALGGSGAVKDSTVQEAWVIKTLANKWDTSYDLPGLKKKSVNLKDLINGVGAKDSRDFYSGDFMGLKKIVKDANRVKDAWDWNYTNLKHKVEEAIDTGSAKKNKEGVLVDTTGVDVALQALYGDAMGSAKEYQEYFEYGEEKDGARPVIGFKFAKFEGTKTFKDMLDAAQKNLKKVWEAQRTTLIDSPVLNEIARRAQLTPQEGAAQGLEATDMYPVAVIRATADWVYDQEKKWLDDAEKDLADANLKLRQDYDKISSKVELRLGGKDRFETAQLIANQYGNLYGGVLNDLPTGVASPFKEAYVANGHRLPDSLTAGQLPSGPILLTTKDGDVPEFTKKVARNLKTWVNDRAHLNVYGIGGTAVLPDTQLSRLVALIDAEAAKYPIVNKGKSGKTAGDEAITVKTGKSAVSTSVVGKADELTVVVTPDTGKPQVTINGDGKLNVDASAATPGTYTVVVLKGKTTVKTFTVNVTEKAMLFASDADAMKGLQALKTGQTNVVVGKFFYDTDDTDNNGKLDGSETTTVAAPDVKVVRVVPIFGNTIDNRAGIDTTSLKGFGASVAGGELKITVNDTTTPAGVYTLQVKGYNDPIDIRVGEAALVAPTNAGIGTNDGWSASSALTAANAIGVTWTPGNNKPEFISGVTYELTDLKYGSATNAVNTEVEASKISTNGDVVKVALNAKVTLELNKKTGVVTFKTAADVAAANNVAVSFKLTAKKGQDTKSTALTASHIQ